MDSMTCVKLSSAVALLALWPELMLADTTYVAPGTLVNQTWSNAGSPYVVAWNISIASLTIGQGVTVILQSDVEVEVTGRLVAIGTEEHPIAFTKPLGGNGWKGILFNFSAPGSELSYCIIEGSVNTGIRIENSTTGVYPTIRHCIIRNNRSGTSPHGGGIYINGTAEVSECVIENNTVSIVADPAFGTGGGIHAEGSITLFNCVVRRNAVHATGDHLFNNATASGGGVYVNGAAIIENCIVDTNTVWSAQDGGATSFSRGGGIYASGRCMVSNSIISGNITSTGGISTTVVKQGGGIYCSTTVDTSKMVNCTVAYNTNDGLRAVTDTLTIVNSIFYFNSPATQQVVGNVRATYSDIQGGFPGTGNINFNPVFDIPCRLVIVDGSPCVDRGDPTSGFEDSCFPPSLGGAQNDIGANGGAGACSWIDASPVLIKVLDTVIAGDTIVPTVHIVNLGASSDSGYVELAVRTVESNEVYIATANVPPLARGEPYNATFPRWTTQTQGVFLATAISHVGGDWHSCNDTLEKVIEVALSIQLSYLTASYIGSMNTVRIDWGTISEINNFGFVVQKSSDTSGYADIPESFIPGHGTTGEPQTYSFVDGTVAPGEWWYRLKQFDLDSTTHHTDGVLVSVPTTTQEDGVPPEFRLYQNFPNPFNPLTEVDFSVEGTRHASVELFNVLGQRIETLFDDEASLGRKYRIRFDASHLAGGVFFYKLTSGSRCEIRKMVVLK